MRVTVDPASCFSSELSSRSEENRCHSLDIVEPPIAAGKQGEIYHLSRINGSHVSGLVVKSFYEEVPPN